MLESAVRYTVLVDNQIQGPGLTAEHGLSIWVEVGEERILFDAGRGAALRANARALGVDLASVTRLVLSHGHYDHSGGLAELGALLPQTTPLYAHPEIFPARYSRHADETIQEIGLTVGTREFLRQRAEHFQPVAKPTEIGPGVWLTGPIPRWVDFEDPGGDFWLDPACTRPDPVVDDLALWLVRPEGLWIFCGCAHSGLINTVEYIQAVSGRRPIQALVGGTHLRHASPERLSRTAAFVRALAPPIIQFCHCSGQSQNAALAD